MRFWRLPAVLALFVLVLAGTGTPSRVRAQSTPQAPPPRPGADAEAARQRPTPQQLANVEARIATASSIVDRLASEAKALGRASEWRQITLQSLLALPLDELRRIEQESSSVDGLAARLAESGSHPAPLGGSTNDLVYKPIVPCRYIDTRNVAGKIAGGVSRGYDLGNNGSVYGGQAACAPNSIFGPPQDAIAALAMNVGITEPNGAPGFLAVKPTLASPVTSFMNWYQAGATVQLANAGIVTLDQNVNVAEEFYIQTSETTHVTVDLFGAFVASLATPLQTIFQQSGSTIIANGSWGEAISPACPLEYTLTGGGCQGGGLIDIAYSSVRAATGNQWHCYADNFTGSQSTLTALAICSRVPGR